MGERTDRRGSAEPYEDDAAPLAWRADRWEWRRKIRADPKKYRVYRLAVGVAGTFLIVLGAATGWLPGPGGIPLVLAGLAVLASEYEWAHRLLLWARQRLQAGRAWLQRQPRWVSWFGGVATVAAICGALWLSLAVFGYPGWTPDLVTSYLGQLPGVGPAQ